MMAAEEAADTTVTGAQTNELRRTFQRLCVDYEDVVDDATELTPPVDERIGLALFKIDEATAVVDMLHQDAAESHAVLMDALLENCRELEDIFIRVNLMESFVAKVQAATRELEARTETIAKASDPVFNTGGVSTLLRSFSIKRPTADPAPVQAKWEPLDLSLGAPQLIERLDRSNAEQLGVSVANRLAPAASSLEAE